MYELDQIIDSEGTIFVGLIVRDVIPVGIEAGSCYSWRMLTDFLIGTSVLPIIVDIDKLDSIFLPFPGGAIDGSLAPDIIRV